MLIDALQPGCLTHKYVDDTTMTEVLGRSAVSSMQSFFDELVQQATDAGSRHDSERPEDERAADRLDRPGSQLSQGPAAVRQSERHARRTRHSFQTDASARRE